MKSISEIASKIQASTTLQIDALYKQMKANGQDVIGFTAGEPDFDTPCNIKEAAYKAISAGYTKYTPAAGITELRSAIADRLKADCGIEYSPNQIVVASGAKHSIYIALQVLLNPGDEVLLPAPYWVTYFDAIKMAGGVPVVLHTSESSNFKITADELKAALTEKSKLLILCNPSNPTGMIYTADELAVLAGICVESDLYILSDEVYYQLVYDGIKFTSVAALGESVKERTIIVNGASKTYAMTGWRIGYTASNSKLAEIMSSYLSHSTSAPCTVSQYAALEAYSGSQESVRSMCETFRERRDFIFERINKMSGVSCIKPNGAFYVMLCIKELTGKTLGGKQINNSDDFALSFLENALVATVSCTGFGIENYVRLTYAASMDDIKEGMDRLERFIK